MSPKTRSVRKPRQRLSPDNPILGGLFGDEEIADHLTGAAEIAAMIRFEAALARAEAAGGVIPADAGDAIAHALECIEITPDSLVTPTAAAGVPVPGLVKHLRQSIGPPHGDYLHWGATSQDVVDTGWTLRLQAIMDIVEERLIDLLGTLGDAAERHADLPMAGRTRSQVATPITLGLRISGWASPLLRCLDRLDELRPRLLVLQLGGASGALSILGPKGPEVTERLARDLGLGIPAKPWNVERDSFVELGNWLAMTTGLIARIGADLILSGRSEIAEIRAGSGGGSSTMPQKANPVLAETLVSLGRLAAGHASALQTALSAVEERDSTAWAVEWQTLPSLLTGTGAALRHARSLADSFEPDPTAMAHTLQSGGGTVHAEAMAFLLAQTMPLSKAQAIVKEAAQSIAGQGNDLSDAIRGLLPDTDVPDMPAGDPGVASASAMTVIFVQDLRARLAARS